MYIHKGIAKAGEAASMHVLAIDQLLACMKGVVMEDVLRVVAVQAIQDGDEEASYQAAMQYHNILAQ